MPHPWKCSGQVGQSSEQADLVKGVPAPAGDLEVGDLWGAFQPKPFYYSMIQSSTCVCRQAESWGCSWIKGSGETLLWLLSTNKMLIRRNFLPQPVVTKQEGMVFNAKRIRLDWTYEMNCLQWGQWGTRTSSPEKLWMPHPWKHWRSSWTELWAVIWLKVSLPEAESWTTWP